jgi:hypothetical protein
MTLFTYESEDQTKVQIIPVLTTYLLQDFASHKISVIHEMHNWFVSYEEGKTYIHAHAHIHTHTQIQ